MELSNLLLLVSSGVLLVVVLVQIHKLNLVAFARKTHTRLPK